ncbi:hypothetical protein EG68_09477 [Paragonimus skrjabini miyazakii]|uniref:type I protein arginine methyltransferase n=1 Tax=Paragonimus skrjabini miyazakii TaxID=59628 RepID=A0A8S9YCK3_9TREM|nr:hypothetical protein EG68_09477 [Paragonimus skrjabini miyazakii]
MIVNISYFLFISCFGMAKSADVAERESISAEDSDEWEEIFDTASSSTEQNMLCLLCPHVCCGTEKFFQHLLSHPKWERLFSVEHCFISDQYDWIRFVNYVRLKKPDDFRQVFHDPSWNSKSEDSFRPVLDDDAVLSIDIEAILEEHGLKPSGDSSSVNNEHSHIDIANILEENRLLREQLVACKRLLSNVLDRPLTSELSKSDLVADSDEVQPVVSAPLNHGRPHLFNNEDPNDSAYFTSYGHFAIHGEMLTDSIRTEAYRDFILSNAPTHFAGKCVLDVGCGSGILSLFAAEAGAATVYGVEASTEIYAASLETVRASKMENRITLIRDRAETVKLPVDKVDVVISEWMGYFLLFESMLDSVLHVARRYLCPQTGRIYPRHYTLNLLAVSCSPTLRHDNVDLWQNVYGYPMPALRRAALSEAHVLSLSDAHPGGGDQRANVVVLTHVPCAIYNLDLYTLWQQGLHDSDFQPLRNLGECPFSLLVDAKPGCAPMVLDAFVGYFDVRFDDDASVQVTFSTSPMAPPTHWKQTVFFLDQPLKVENGDRVTGSLTVRRSVRDTRGLEFSLRVDPLRDQPVVYQSYLAFLNPEFDHKHWINEALKSAVLEHNVEQKASELVLQLQTQMKDVMQTVDRACLDAMHSIPRVIREVEALKVDATALGSELDTMRESVSRVDPNSQQTISRLAELDRTRRNAQAAANALRETERWSTLVHAMDELMSAGEVDQVCCNIEGMEQCLASLTHLPDYADRVALVAQHKNSLESLIAPQLIRALEHTVPTGSVADTETDMIYAKREARHLIDLFRRIGRLEAAVNYYTNWLKVSCVTHAFVLCANSQTIVLVLMCMRLD